MCSLAGGLANGNGNAFISNNPLDHYLRLSRDADAASAQVQFMVAELPRGWMGSGHMHAVQGVHLWSLSSV